MNSRLEESLGVRRVMAILVLAFAGICLFLAAVGLNGVVSQFVGDRTPEIGIRMALGARPVQVLLLFLRFGLVWGGVGAAAGLLAALYAQRWLKDYLFGVQPFDPMTFAAATSTVVLIVLAAVWRPAWRASCTAPQSVLRHE